MGPNYSEAEIRRLRLLRPCANIKGKKAAADRLHALFPGRSLDSIAQNLNRIDRREGFQCLYSLKRSFSLEEEAEFERLAKEAESLALSEQDDQPKEWRNETFSEDEWKFSAVVNKRIRTLEELLEYCEADLTVWEVKTWKCGQWEQASKNAQHDVQITPQWKIEATFVYRKQAASDREDFQWLIDECKAHAPVYFDLQREPFEDEGHLAILNLTDIHLGKLCWAEEVGNDYDLAIAEQIWMLAVEDLLRKINVYPISLMHLIIGHDFFNSDNIIGTTTAGTPQDNDGRFHKIYRRGIQLLIATIDRALSVAPVSVMFLPGNHDTLSCFTAGVAIECHYHKANEVEIINSPNLRQYFEWHKNMFCHVHGNKINVEKLPLVMATEQPEMLGRTIYREAQTGDKHHYTAKDVMGTQVLKLPSLAGVDAYHHNNLYVGSRRSGIARVFHPTEGPVAQLMFNLNQARVKVLKKGAA